jgi:hypothetical protein
MLANSAREGVWFLNRKGEVGHFSEILANQMDLGASRVFFNATILMD